MRDHPPTGPGRVLTWKGRCTIPAKYEAIRDKFKAEGMDEAQAKTRAAKIFNATRKEGVKPVTGKHESGPPKRVGVRRRAK